MKKIVVIKIGTRVLVSTDGKINLEILQSLAGQVAHIRTLGFRPIVVTSGAIACGNGIVGRERIIDKQVAAGVGQPKLMAHWSDAFSQWGLITFQGLGTRRDFSDRNPIAVIRRTLELGIIPILNENDSVSSEEIRALKLQGDNDALAAIIAEAIEAEKLILLISDADGLLDQNRTLIPVVPVIDDYIMGLNNVILSDRDTGMGPKLKAAKKATQAGIVVHLARGGLADVVIRIIQEDPAPGTTFLARA